MTTFGYARRMAGSDAVPTPETPLRQPLAGLWMWVLLALAVTAVVTIHRDFGTTWDEGVQARYGELALAYFASGGDDKQCNRYLDLRFYGPLFEMIPAVFYRPGNRFEVRHLILGLLAVWILPAVALYGRIFRLPWLPLFAAAALVMLPRFAGHSFNNSKDVPFAVATAWFLLAAVHLALRRGGTAGRTIACGATLGLALCARPAGFPLLALYLLAVLGLATSRLDAVERRSTWLEGLVAMVIGWAVMVLPWPWAHGDPVARPLEAMLESAAIATAYPVLFRRGLVQARSTRARSCPGTNC